MVKRAKSGDDVPPRSKKQRVEQSKITTPTSGFPSLRSPGLGQSTFPTCPVPLETEPTLPEQGIATNQMIDTLLAIPKVRRKFHVWRHRNCLMHANFKSERDPRDAIVVRNSMESPLLRLPGEIRTMIWEFALGGQHIHILSDPPTVGSQTTSSLVQVPIGPELPSMRRTINFDQMTKMEVWTFYNVVYPLEWRQFYDVGEWDNVGHWSAIVPRYWTGPLTPRYCSKRLIRDTESCMTLVPAVCRQIYHETNILPYRLNEFSFQDQATIKDWLLNRVPVQRRALKTIWFDIEWSRWIDMFDSSQQLSHGYELTSIKISRLALRAIENWFTTSAPAYVMNEPLAYNFMLERERVTQEWLLKTLQKSASEVSIEFVD